MMETVKVPEILDVHSILTLLTAREDVMSSYKRYLLMLVYNTYQLLAIHNKFLTHLYFEFLRVSDVNLNVPLKHIF